MELFFLLLLLFFFYFLSWLFSGYEIGLISLDKLKMEQEAKKNSKKKKILDFYQNNDQALGTTMIGNTIVNVVIATISTYILCDRFSFNDLYATILVSFTVLVYCEIYPKNFFHDYPERLVDLFFPIIYTANFLLKPFITIVTFLNSQIKKLFHVSGNYAVSSFTKDDISYILEETFNQGQITIPQKEMLEDALEFNELIAKNVMKPRTEIIGIESSMPYSEIIRFVKQEGYTRYPVYQKTLDNITGVLIIYDLLKNEDSTLTANDLQREMYYVPESMDVNTLLKTMQTLKKSIVVVCDSYGGTSGIVTVEDILEEIVGEIDDEYDIEEINDVEKIGTNAWLVNAFVEVDTLNDDFDLKIPDGEYETIAGLIISQLATIPKRGQKIIVEDYTFEVVEVTNKKIKKVKILKND